jgi:hypothetical protein
MKLALLAAMLLIATPAMAQLTIVLPESGGGYMVLTPGQPMTTILPEQGGGYLILNPGKPSTLVLPQPGQAPTFDQYRPLDQSSFNPR